MSWTKRIEALEEKAVALRHRRPLAITFPLPADQSVPRQADRIGDELGAYIVTLETDVRAAVVERLIEQPSPRQESDLVVLHLREHVARLVLTGAPAWKEGDDDA